MNLIWAWAVMYTISVRTPVPCGDNVHGSPNVTFSCSETNGQSHFVEFTNEAKALRFIHNLKAYSHVSPLDKTVRDGKRFIWDLHVQTFTKVNGKWIKVNDHYVLEDENR